LSTTRTSVRGWLSRPSVRAAVLAAAVALSACGGASEAESEKPLPGLREFGLTSEEFNAHVEQTQAAIAECMQAQGFEYIPVDVKTIEAAQARMRQEPGYTRRTYKEKWGLGVTTRLDNPVRETGLGPNLEIYNGLPEAEQVAYYRALFGDYSNHDFAFALDEEDFSDTAGCTREAVEQVFTPQQIKGNYVNPKDVLVDSDPRIVEAHRRWAKCMHDAGYDYEYDQDEIIEEFQDRLEELTDGEDPATLTGARLETLHRIQQEEIAAALVDLDCQIEHTDEVYRIVETEVYGEPLG
jgi:hypothetical protein